jgi:hypothetical protein
MVSAPAGAPAHPVGSRASHFSHLGRGQEIFAFLKILACENGLELTGPF